MDPSDISVNDINFGIIHPAECTETAIEDDLSNEATEPEQPVPDHVVQYYIEEAGGSGIEEISDQQIIGDAVWQMIEEIVDIAAEECEEEQTDETDEEVTVKKDFAIEILHAANMAHEEIRKLKPIIPSEYHY